jgi:hypothetical protein
MVLKEIVGAIAAARNRLYVASVVLSSGPILAALSEAIDRGMPLGGLYDGPQIIRSNGSGRPRMLEQTNSILGRKSRGIWYGRIQSPLIVRISHSHTTSCTTSLSSRTRLS